MLGIRYILFAGILSITVFAQEAKQDGRLTLEQAKQFAIGHNYEVQARKHEWDQALAEARRARAPYYPKIGVAAGADTLTGTSFDNTGPVANLYVSMNLFNGFLDALNARKADLLAEKAEIQFRRAEFRVGLDVEQEFHTLLFKKCQLELNEAALALNKTQQKMALNRKSSGMGAESDILDFDTREALLKSDAYAVEQEMEEGRAQLRRLLGEEVGAAVQPIGHLQHQHLNGKLMDFVNRMKRENETILVAAKDVGVADVESDMWRASLLPRVDIEVRAGYLSLDYRPQSNMFNFLGLAYLKWELFSGFDSVWQNEQVTHKRLGAEARLKDSILTSVTQMEIAYRRIKTIQHRVDLEDKNEDRAQRYYKVVLSEYRRGIKNSADLRMAAESVYSIGLRKKQFQYDFLMEKVKLERALGAPIQTELINDE